MASRFTAITNGGVEVTLSTGYDAELQAVCEGPWSSQLAYDYCNDISAYCDVDNCSDSAFARALDMIDQWVKHECFEEVQRTHTSAGAETHQYKAAYEVWRRYENVVMEDRELDGASPETVRQKFQTWITSRGVERNQTSRYRYCILIDADVLETLNRFPSPPLEDEEEEWQLYSLKVIDVEIDGESEDEYPRGYRSCVMTPPWMLAHIYFYCHNVGADEMRIKSGDIPVYAMAEAGI